MARGILRVAAGIFICTAIGIALHQIIGYGWWQWDEMLSLYHHEGVVLVTALLGIWLGLLSFKA